MMTNFMNENVELFDQPLKPANNLAAFAYTNAFLHQLSRMNAPLLHFWTLEDTLILGLKDQRLPHLTDALKWLQNKPYHFFVRNSGGLAVISDSGILNFSIFFPFHLEDHELGIDEVYQRMTDVVAAAFPEITVTAGEIKHSYCPGSFDLSVNGKKIGGMSQRRNHDGSVVMLYIGVDGDQMSRGELVRDFYGRGLRDEDNKWNFPDVWPAEMATLTDVMNSPITMAEAQERLTNAFSHVDTAGITQLTWSPEFITHLGTDLKSIQRLQERIGGNY